jgi:RNA polymerase sigma-70 factor (ECF subfamily)
MPKKPEELSDEELLLHCKERDADRVREAVDILVRRHSRPLLGYLYHFVGDKEIAEDLVQEAFIRVYRKAREYKKVAKFRTWLYKIAINLAINELRNRRHRPSLSLNNPVGAPGSRGELIRFLAGREPDPAVAAEKRDISKVVHEVIGTLPEIYRSVMLLCDIEHFSYAEAAEALTINIGTVRSRLSRAREKFEEKMAPHMERWKEKT